ncbi:MAG: acyl-CoA synthetase [candidate division WOR-3 bacterium]|jgi:acetyl-CoA synthetase
MKHNMENYEATYRSFKWEIPEFYNFAYDTVDQWGARDRTKLALISVADDGRTAQKHTFWELSRLSSKFANLLLAAGARKGDKLLVLLPRIPEWYVAVLGAMKAGVIFMPTPTLSMPRDIEYRLNSSKANFAITDGENAFKIAAVQGNCPALKQVFIVNGEKEGWINFNAEMEKAPVEIQKRVSTRSDEPLLIYFTSGTVGYPKMVQHTHAYPLAHIVTAKFVHDLQPNDIHWTIADTGWAKTAWGKLFGQWLIGCTVLQRNPKGKFNPQIALQVLENFGVTTFCAPPTVYRLLILEDLKKYRLSLRHCVSAGEPLNPEVIRAWEAGTGLKIYDFYGQTETVAVLANYPCLPVKEGSMGKPTPGHEVAIVDEQGKELPAGEEGHIAIRVKPFHPPGIFKGYLNQPGANEVAFRGDWYYTGDKAYKDEDGYFWFVGRADDVIKASGYRIGPFEVESALIEHPAVQESAVIGKPDPVRGEIVKAFVILKPGYEPSAGLVRELQEHCKRVTAPYKYPREIEFVNELPKTISGKIRRGELRRLELQKMQSHRQPEQR